MNRKLLGLFGTLEPTQKVDRKKYIESLVYSNNYFHNWIPHETTHVAPFELMFGSNPKFPLDAASDIHRCKTGVAQEYLGDLKDGKLKTQDIIQDHIKKAQLKQKIIYERMARYVEIDVWDKVLVKSLAFNDKHKIQVIFEGELNEVIDQLIEDIAVNKVRSRRSQKTKVLWKILLQITTLTYCSNKTGQKGTNQEQR